MEQRLHAGNSRWNLVPQKHSPSHRGARCGPHGTHNMRSLRMRQVIHLYAEEEVLFCLLLFSVNKRCIQALTVSGGKQEERCDMRPWRVGLGLDQGVECDCQGLGEACGQKQIRDQVALLCVPLLPDSNTLVQAQSLWRVRRKQRKRCSSRSTSWRKRGGAEPLCQGGDDTDGKKGMKGGKA